MNVWFAAVAYGDRDYGEGPTRLFARSYDHEPTEAEVTHDAFVEAVPDWKERYPGYTLHAAAYEWEGTLQDALSVAILSAGPTPTCPPICLNLNRSHAVALHGLPRRQIGSLPASESGEEHQGERG